jgi:hypothetical protein
MKNVKVILVGVALCATIFANQRIDALGGDSGFWSGDKDNINTFPAAVNDHGFVEVDGVGAVGGTGDISATIVWGDATKWGFKFSEAADDTWFDMMWGSGDMGIRAALVSSTANADAEGTTGFSFGYGQNFSWGELGVNLMSLDDATEYGLDWRGDLGFWAFDTAKFGMDMTDNGAGTTTMNLDFDMFTHMDAGGADVLFGLGFGYESWDLAGNAVSRMTLPAATVAVEADMTDWATFRCFVNTNYAVATTADAAVLDTEGNAITSLVDGYTGSSTTYGFGLGFNWGGLTADMSISENVLQDPVSYMTGYETDALTTAGVTLTYSF